MVWPCNQVSHIGRTMDMLVPFKPLLSSKLSFKWDLKLEEAFQHSKETIKLSFKWDLKLEEAFQHSKEAIISEIKAEVEIFDPGKWTCLYPNWSRTGVVYWLPQNHCGCESNIPRCCADRWQITLGGSCFLRDVEKWYAPVKGEAFGSCIGNFTNIFTMGCHDLSLTTDHKLLVKILGDQALDNIITQGSFD